MKLIYRTLIIFLVLWIGLLLITFNKHLRREPNTYHSEIWADKAGYYVYLPATFIYHWQGDSIPESIHKQKGDGFKIIGNHVVTKYPMGVAVMMSPVWLVNHYFIADVKDGFSFSYTLVSSVAATFYVLIGLFISYACYKKYTTSIRSLSICILLFISTNLFYYTVLENGMSHAFSFFWFSLLLFVILDIKQRTSITYKDTLSLGIITGFIMLIRPINCVFCLPYFLILVIQNPNIKSTIKELLFTTKSLLIYLLAILIITPQIIYYKSISSIKAPYSGEGFSYLTSPKILSVLFAPENGLFLYTPIVLFIFVLLFIYRKSIPFIIPICVLFSLVVYVYASWSSPELGCAFGYRGMVEFYSLIFLPFAFINVSRKLKFTFIFIAVLCTLYTLKLSLSYDGCFGGSNYWDWSTYSKLLFSNIK
ncbi:hypothetical protein [Cytophaga aurantiaca]|uniref:hypothetical protein n=1 Tax=Cytophaga aurantiaca TaxID=29530 RepID=UPI00036BF3C4|nr:hypothetical protein [Cytophaga aurantiaca]